jgi:hypothetical protein
MGAGMAMTIGAREIGVVDVVLVVLSVTGEALVVVGALIVVDCPLELSGRRRDTTLLVVVVEGVVVVDVVVVVVEVVVSSNKAKGDSVSI